MCGTLVGREAAESYRLWDLSAFGVIFHSSRTAVKKSTYRPHRGDEKKKENNAHGQKRKDPLLRSNENWQASTESGVPSRQALKTPFHPLHILAFFCSDLRSN